MNINRRSTLSLVGQKVGRYLVQEHLGCLKGRAKLRCLCTCGITKVVMAQSLLAGTTLSCGCQRRDSIRASEKVRTKTHGDSVSREYKIWAGVKKRCQNRNHHAYPRYGGRGIKLCDSWQQYSNFLRDMGRCPPGLSIDRIDNDGDYTPGNCRWADRFTQAQNKSTTKYVALGESKLSLAKFQTIFDVNYCTAYYRLFVSPKKEGWARKGMDSVKSATDLIFEEAE